MTWPRGRDPATSFGRLTSRLNGTDISAGRRTRLKTMANRHSKAAQHAAASRSVADGRDLYVSPIAPAPPGRLRKFCGANALARES